MTSRQVILHCTLISGVGDVAISKICTALGDGHLSDVYRFTAYDFVERCGIPLSQAQILKTGLEDGDLLDRENGLLEQNDIAWTTIADADYPALLKTIYAPPSVLFWRGMSPAESIQAIACVGARAANRYAHTVIKHLLPELVETGWTIVSGGALGADTMAHEVTLSVGGRTIAVIGSGLLRPYPGTNRKLFERIESSGGCVMSIFPSEAQAMPGNFPARNRVIAGLSKAVVVVQAAEKSGARITALQALEQGREVCVVPGDIFDPLSAGCHRLMSEGATPVTSASDILRACGYESVATNTQNGVFSEAKSEQVDPLVRFCSEARTFDELLDRMGGSFGELQARLFNLQLEGVLTQDFLGRWSSI